MLFGDKELNFDTPKIMGIINITPDSFSDGGKFFSKKSSQIKLSKVLKEIDLMEKNGSAFTLLVRWANGDTVPCYQYDIYSHEGGRCDKV